MLLTSYIEICQPLFKVISLVHDKMKHFQIKMQGEQLNGSLNCPFSSGINPHYQSAKEHLNAWIETTGLVEKNSKLHQKFLAADFAKLVAYTYRDPSDFDSEKLNCITEFVGWLFCHDDFRDNTRSQVGKDPALVEKMNKELLKALKEGVFCEANLQFESAEDTIYIQNMAKNLVKIRENLLKFGKDIDPFVESLEGYFSGNRWEATNRMGKPEEYPGEEEHKRMREYTSAVYSAYEIAFLIANINIPTKLRKDSVFKTMMAASSLCICFTNDIFSGPKEEKEGVKENLFLIKRQHCGTYQEALEETTQAQNDVLKSYNNSKEMLRKLYINDPETLRILDKIFKIIEDWIRGNYDWSIETKRYN